MLGRLLGIAGKGLCRHRNNWAISRVNRALKLLYFHTENSNYNFSENGEKRVLRILTDFCFETFVDIGLNRGTWTSAVKELRPSAKVHAFEASPITFPHAQRALADFSDVVLNNVALYDRAGKMDFFHANEDDGRSSFFEKKDVRSVTRTTVDVITLDQYASEKNLNAIDFVKIDTEGADYLILKGARNLLETRRIKAIQFEYGFSSVDTGHLLKDYYALLRRCGYAVGKMYPTSIEFREYDRTMENFLGPNFVAVREDLGPLIEALR